MEDEWVKNTKAEIRNMAKATYYYGIPGCLYNAVVWIVYFECYDNKIWKLLLVSTTTVNCCLSINESIEMLFHDEEFRMALIEQMIESNKNR